LRGEEEDDDVEGLLDAGGVTPKRGSAPKEETVGREDVDDEVFVPVWKRGGGGFGMSSTFSGPRQREPITMTAFFSGIRTFSIWTD